MTVVGKGFIGIRGPTARSRHARSRAPPTPLEKMPTISLHKFETSAVCCRTIPVSSYAEMKAHIDSGDPSRAGMYLAAWTCDTENEDFIQQDSKATLR